MRACADRVGPPRVPCHDARAYDPVVPSPPPPPPGVRQQLRGLARLRSAPPRRWAFSLRAACCMAVPILVGWLAGSTPAGMMAATGGFTALYGSGRPYPSRARELALIAAGFAVCTTVGIAAIPLGVVAVVVVLAATAMVATWLGNAFAIGPPGPYMFLLSTAAATGPLGQSAHPLTAGLLVLAGGTFAWVVHMAGALFSPTGPERAAVVTAGEAVAAHVGALGREHEPRTRHEAARALHRAWTVLVDQQPGRRRESATVRALGVANRRLHSIFADAVHAAARDEGPPAGALEEIRGLQAVARSREPEVPDPIDDDAGGGLPSGHPGTWSVLTEALAPGSSIRTAVLRVGVAALVVGAVGAEFRLERSYWAVAAAVLVLHQGLDWSRTLVRSTERLLGTWVGLLLAWALLMTHPTGPWLALVVMVLQFTIEMLVLRNYAVAVVFITSAALVLASGGHRVPDVGSYVLARGVDTAVGCGVALLVCLAIRPRTAPRLPLLVVRLLAAVDELGPHLASGVVGSEAARTARRRVQHQIFALDDAYHVAVAVSSSQRRRAEDLWPVVAAAHQLAYRALALCWVLERPDPDRAGAERAELLGEHAADRLHRALDVLARSVASGRAPGPLGPVPPALESELLNLHDCLSPVAPGDPARG